MRLTNSKIGECAVAIYFGLEPLVDVHWAMFADDGKDLSLPNGIRADVKTTPGHYRKLLWSLEVNDLYWQKTFNVLIACSIDSMAAPGECAIEGFITKEDFFRTKQISDGSDGLDPDTWNVPKTDLLDIERLRTLEIRRGKTG